MSRKQEAKSSIPDGVEYKNEGFLRWERLRLEWLKPVAGQIPKKRKSEIKVKSIDPEEIIERIFSPTGSGILPESIPLPQMIDILIDFWEADGLFD